MRFAEVALLPSIKDAGISRTGGDGQQNKYAETAAFTA